MLALSVQIKFFNLFFTLHLTVDKIEVKDHSEGVLYVRGHEQNVTNTTK